MIKGDAVGVGEEGVRAIKGDAVGVGVAGLGVGHETSPARLIRARIRSRDNHAKRINHLIDIFIHLSYTGHSLPNHTMGKP